jgi:hypothetical protein
MRLFHRFAVPALFIMLFSSAFVLAQRPRVSSEPAEKSGSATQTGVQAPQPLHVKYEGGVFGYNHTMTGTLVFDDVNSRLLFKNKDQKEVLFIPYNAVVAAHGDKQAKRPAAATVASSVPAPYGLNLPAAFIKTKHDYLTLEFNDPDTRVSGITSFRLDNKEELTSALTALSNRSELTQRGEIYVRKAKPASDTQSSSPE